MTEPNEFMRATAAGADSEASTPGIPTDRPTSARMYGLMLGGKDNYEVDREAAAAFLEFAPELLDVARQNRLFLYRAVRYLARDAGINQFLDLGSGLPTENNVHEVAQAFRPEARVVYVDNDPIVLVHGRALLDESDATAITEADITEAQQVLNAPETQNLLDLSQPVAVLLFSIPHNIADDDDARRAVRGCLDAVPSGSYLAVSHIVVEDDQHRAEGNRYAREMGVSGKTRSTAEVNAMLEGLEPVEPGLCDITDWRPDPDQPPLPEPHPKVARYLGAAKEQALPSFEYGGVLRKP